MRSFGESLREEREARSTSIEELAVATGIERTFLEALENNDLHALPGPAFGKLYIRAYAEILGFDPQRLIDAYEREQRMRQPASNDPPPPEPAAPRRVESAIARWREAKVAERVRGDEPRREEPPALPYAELPGPGLEATEAVAAGASVDETDEEAVASPPFVESRVDVPGRGLPSSRPLVVPLLFFLFFLLLFLGAAATYFFGTGPEESETPPSVAVEPAIPEKDAGEDPGSQALSPEPLSVPAPPPAVQRPATPATARRPTVSDFGVGRRIVKRRLEGEDDRFREGEVVWFSTRVLGGSRGESVRHLWLHEGRVVQTIELGVRGPSWRTHSSKTLRGIGDWAVEARDVEDRVLARATFTCIPAGPVDRRARLRPPSSE